MPKKNDFKLDVVSVRLVKDAPIYSEHQTVDKAPSCEGAFLVS